MKRGPRARSLAERMQGKVDAGGECHDWTGARDAHGYGRINRGGRSGRTLLAHRVAWALANDRDPLDLPADLVIRHKCDRPSCVNPEHLESGTHADNSRDMVERGRSRKVEPFVELERIPLSDEEWKKIEELDDED